MKTIIFMAFVLMTITSCSDQDERSITTLKERASLSVKIDMSKFTRSNDSNLSGLLPEINQMILIVQDNEGTIIKDSVITSDFNSPIDLIEKSVSEKLIGGKVSVYAVTEGNNWGILSKTNLPKLAQQQLDINQWQKDQVQTKGGFLNVPYYGSAPIINNGINLDSHILLTANVTITPELGRVQVLGTPSGGTKKVGSKDVEVSNVQIKNVYISNVFSNGDLLAPRGNGFNDWESPSFFGQDGSLFSMQDNNSGYGYQVFNGNNPHIIVKISYRTSVDNANPKDHIGFITIKNFTYDSVTNGDLTIVKGLIYNVDLGKLVLYYDNIGDEPYDSTLYYDLVTTVSVEPWSVVNVTPTLPSPIMN